MFDAKVIFGNIVFTTLLPNYFHRNSAMAHSFKLESQQIILQQDTIQHNLQNSLLSLSQLSIRLYISRASLVHIYQALLI